MMDLLRIISIAAIVSAVLAITSCRPDYPTDRAAAPDEPELRVGITANAPPFVFKQAGSVTGLEPALAEKLGAYLEKKIVFVEVPWNEQFDYLNDGKTDIVMSGMTITRQRAAAVNFSKPYLRSGQIMLVRAEDRQRFSSGMDTLLNTNYRIGTVAGTVSDLFISTTINGADETPFAQPQDAVAALINGTIDTFVYDAPIICYYAARHQQDKLIPILKMGTEEYIGWAMRKNDTALNARVNEFIDAINEDGSLIKEIDYWIPYLNRTQI